MHCILSGIPLALWTKRPCKGCWLSLFIVIYWSQLWGQAGSGSRKSSTSLLKESFCDQAKTSGVILDSSNSFMPHFQTVSKSCKSYFENVSSIWLLLNNSTAMTLGHAPVIRPHQLNCGGSSSPHSLLCKEIRTRKVAVAEAANTVGGGERRERSSANFWMCIPFWKGEIPTLSLDTLWTQIRGHCSRFSCLLY